MAFSYCQQAGKTPSALKTVSLLSTSIHQRAKPTASQPHDHSLASAHHCTTRMWVAELQMRTIVSFLSHLNQTCLGSDFLPSWQVSYQSAAGETDKKNHLNDLLILQQQKDRECISQNETPFVWKGVFYTQILVLVIWHPLNRQCLGSCSPAWESPPIAPAITPNWR